MFSRTMTTSVSGKRVRTPSKRLARPDAGVEVQLLAQQHVDRAKARADRRRRRALDARPRCASATRASPPGSGLPCLRYSSMPASWRSQLKCDARGLEDAPGGLGQLGAGAVAGDEGHVVRHRCSAMPTATVSARHEDHLHAHRRGARARHGLAAADRPGVRRRRGRRGRAARHLARRPDPRPVPGAAHPRAAGPRRARRARRARQDARRRTSSSCRTSARRCRSSRRRSPSCRRRATRSPTTPRTRPTRRARSTTRSRAAPSTRSCARATPTAARRRRSRPSPASTRTRWARGRRTRGRTSRRCPAATSAPPSSP